MPPPIRKLGKMSAINNVIVPWSEFVEYVFGCSNIAFVQQQDIKNRYAPILTHKYEGDCIKMYYTINREDKIIGKEKNLRYIFTWNVRDKDGHYVFINFQQFWYLENSDFERWIDKVIDDANYVNTEDEDEDNKDLVSNKYDNEIKKLGVFEASRKWLRESNEQRQKLEKQGDEAFIEALKRLVAHKDKQIKEITEQKDMFAKENAVLKRAIELSEAEESAEVAKLGNYVERLQLELSKLKQR